MEVLRADGRDPLCSGRETFSQSFLSLVTDAWERSIFLICLGGKWWKLKDMNQRMGQEEFIFSAGSLSTAQKVNNDTL